MALVVFFQEDEDVLSVYRNLKIFCETAHRCGQGILPILCEKVDKYQFEKRFGFNSDKKLSYMIWAVYLSI